MEEDLLAFDTLMVAKLFKFDDSASKSGESKFDLKKHIGNILLEVKSFALLGHESLWRIICTTQYEDVLIQ